MRSPFLLWLIGFTFVLGPLFAGAQLGKSLHSWLTAEHDFFYVVWLWVAGLPFWWLFTRHGEGPRFRHYLALLPWLLTLGAINSLFEPGSPWRFVVFGVGAFLFGTVSGVVFVVEQKPDSLILSSPNSTPE